MNVFVLNAGSSTLKFQLIQTDDEAMAADRDLRLVRGVLERIGGMAIVTAYVRDQPRAVVEMPIRDHREAIERIVQWAVSPESGLEEIGAPGDIHAVGHRVVHGGQRFRESVRIDDAVLTAIEDHAELAPLHNVHNIHGIRAVREILGTAVPQVAVFDTAFHATMPETSFLYAIPYHYYRRFRIRRYGFHGTSHRYVAERYARLTGRALDQQNVITLHLGNGSSACAIRGGASFDTTMGFTPLEGLVMGTRSGDVDPSIIDFLGYKEGLSPGEVETLLNKQSGLLGISGMTSDMRELLEEEAETGDRRVALAIAMFCQRVRKTIGGYFAEMGGADAVIFAGGIGENAPRIRELACEGLGCLGLELDPTLNARTVKGEAAKISTATSKLEAWVIPTDEELLIARDTARLVAAG